MQSNRMYDNGERAPLAHAIVNPDRVWQNAIRATRAEGLSMKIFRAAQGDDQGSLYR